MKKLNKERTEKLALIIIVTLITLVILNNLFIKGMQKKINSNRNTLRNLKLKYAQELQKVSEIEEKREEIKLKQKRYNDLREGFVLKKEEKILIRSITDLSQKWNLDVEKMTINETDKNGKNIFKIDLGLDSEFKGLVNYLFELKDLNKRVYIDTINISKNKEKLKISLNLFTYMIEEVNEDDE